MLAMEAPLQGRYRLGKSLGSGSHGHALLATRIPDNQAVVIKQVSCQLSVHAVSKKEQGLSISYLPPLQVDTEFMTEKEKQSAINEVKVMNELDHLNVVKHYEYFEQVCRRWS